MWREVLTWVVLIWLTVVVVGLRLWMPRAAQRLHRNDPAARPPVAEPHEEP